MQLRLVGRFLAFCVLAPGLVTQAVAQVETPSQLYGELFEDVQMRRVFPDGKTFVDAVAKDAPAAIVQRYQEEKRQPGFDLAAFVAQNFTVSRPEDSGYHSIPGQDVCSHIDALWPVLARRPDRADPRASLLPLPHPYVVPGGRFNEIYYWDSYFTMLGLEESGRPGMALNMVRNFVSLIDRYGHVPNGNRTYYLSRSQPPFFAAMVELIANEAGDREAVYAEFLDPLREEYAFWMAGGDALAPGAAHRRVVRLKDGTLLNRYWDDRSARLRKSTGTCGQRPKAAGISARAGSRTAGRSPPSARRSSCRSISTASWSSSRPLLPRLTPPPACRRRRRSSMPAPSCVRMRCGAISGMPKRASLPTTCGARGSRAAW
jgi:alpha,alpha-trehalase